VSANLVWDSHPTPMYFICDSSCDQVFVISDTDAGVRDLNRLFGLVAKSVPDSEHARELASLAVLLVKRTHTDPKSTKVKESTDAFVVTLRYQNRRFVVSVNRQDASVVWSK